MTPEELRRKVAAELLGKAARDLNSARLLAAEEAVNSMFFSQQAAEKSAKAFLTAHDVAFRKTHDLRELGIACTTILPALAPHVEACEPLTPFAVEARYLRLPLDPEAGEALEALAKATALYDAVKSELGL